MKLLILLFLLPVIGVTQTDFNYEFITGAYTESQGVLSGQDTLRYNLKHIVKKEYDHLVIASVGDMGNIKYSGKLSFIGIQVIEKVWMIYSDGEERMIRINPIFGIVEIKENDELKLKFGQSSFH